jgi:predicted Holliday junction resolvase-like endonuclease
MDPDLLLIFGFVLVVGVLALLTGVTIHSRDIKHQERKLELEARIAEARAMEKRAEAVNEESLENRIRVLERIATDKGDDLASQIEDLRDMDTEEGDRLQ